MRIAAAVLLFAACLFAGGLARDALRRNVRMLEQLCLFLRQLRFRVRLHRPLGAVIAELAAQPDLSMLTFLADCAALCRKGTPLPQAWRLAVSAFTRSFHLSVGQLPPLAEYIPALASADGRQVEALLELYETQSRDALLQAQKKSERLGGLYLQIGGAVGVLLCIMIL